MNFVLDNKKNILLILNSFSFVNKKEETQPWKAKANVIYLEEGAYNRFTSQLKRNIEKCIEMEQGYYLHKQGPLSYEELIDLAQQLNPPDSP